MSSSGLEQRGNKGRKVEERRATGFQKFRVIASEEEAGAKERRLKFLNRFRAAKKWLFLRIITNWSNNLTVQYGTHKITLLRRKLRITFTSYVI